MLTTHTTPTPITEAVALHVVHTGGQVFEVTAGDGSHGLYPDYDEAMDIRRPLGIDAHITDWTLA